MTDIPASRIWAMPSKHTFQVKPLLGIVMRYKRHGDVWIDPFAGFYSPCEATNDLNPDTPTTSHMEAFEFCKQQADASFDGAVFDPPYSLTKLLRCYQGVGLKSKGSENPTGGFPKVKDEIERILRPGGICVSFGWNTAGMGEKRGFRAIEYVICSHGGNRNDTLVTVETKL